MLFRIRGLHGDGFAHLYGLDDARLALAGARRSAVTARPGTPDRVTLRDLEVGETALLVNFVHLETASPYRASHAVFVREGATTPYDEVDRIPPVLTRRVLSLRAFDRDDLLVAGELAFGERALRATIGRLLADRRVTRVHAHFARFGCYAARIERAEGQCRPEFPESCDSAPPPRDP